MFVSLAILVHSCAVDRQAAAASKQAKALDRQASALELQARYAGDEATASKELPRAVRDHSSKLVQAIRDYECVCP